MVTICSLKLTATCLPIILQCFDTISLASTDIVLHQTTVALTQYFIYPTDLIISDIASQMIRSVFTLIFLYCTQETLLVYVFDVINLSLASCLKQHFTIHCNSVPWLLICERVPLPSVLMVVQRCLPGSHPTTQEQSSISFFRCKE